MTYQQERDEFIAAITAEGLPVYQARKVLAIANRLQIIAELSCSSEAADRDRVPCPATRRGGKPDDCICDYSSARLGEPEGAHYTVPRIDREEARKQKRVTKLLATYNMAPDFQGDPRGCVFAVKVPSGKTNDFTSTRGICVPAKGLPASFWERNR